MKKIGKKLRSPTRSSRVGKKWFYCSLSFSHYALLIESHLLNQTWILTSSSHYSQIGIKLLIGRQWFESIFLLEAFQFWPKSTNIWIKQLKIMVIKGSYLLQNSKISPFLFYHTYIFFKKLILTWTDIDLNNRWNNLFCRTKQIRFH